MSPCNKKCTPKPTEDAKDVKKSSSKAVVTEDMPKKPITPYFRFMAEKRVAVKESNPGNRFVAKEIGNMWKELSSDEKAVYTKAYQEDKKNYEIEAKEFAESHPEVIERIKQEKKEKAAAKKQRAAKKADKKAPKKAAKKAAKEESEEDDQTTTENSNVASEEEEEESAEEDD